MTTQNPVPNADSNSVMRTLGLENTRRFLQMTFPTFAFSRHQNCIVLLYFSTFSYSLLFSLVYIFDII